MNAINYDNVLDQLQSHGFIISTLQIGGIVRVKRDNAKQKGWYVLHEVNDNNKTALIGSFGYWTGAESYTEKISPSKEFTLTPEQREAQRKQYAEAKKKAEAEQIARAERASQEATKAWHAYISEGESPYLQRKNVRAHGIKFAPSGNGTIAIPMRDTKAKVWGLQIIRGKDRGNKLEKEYWPKGLSKKGKFHTLGSLTPHTPLVLIGEGYATCATLYQATDIPTAVAFDAGNLMDVAQAIHKAYPRTKIIICADDDYLTDGNPGCAKAEAAAIAVSGSWIKPIFPADRQGKKLTDFNDLAEFPNCSESTVRVQVEDKFKSLGVLNSALQAVGVGASTGGQGKPPSTLKSLLQVEDAVDRYSLIYGAGGTMYDHQEKALIPKQDVLDICVDHAWREWKINPMRSVVRLSEVGFDPTESDPNILCNLWGGWPTQPKHGPCEILLDLLRHLCKNEESKDSDAIYQWVLKWLALPIQKPGAKMKTALVFHGAQGAGKNLFFEAYAKIFGRYSRIVGQAEIDDKFNDWASGKLFMIADEVIARQELFHSKNKLKALVTGDNIRINPKNVAAHDERNHVNLVFLSNEKQPLVLENDDRRYVVIWVPETLSNNYYSDVAEEIKSGGIEALHDYLLHLPLDDFNEHSKPPMTKAKADLININMESTDRFLDEWQSEMLAMPICPVVSEDLYKTYLDWCKRNGVARPRELNQFMGIIAKLNGWKKERVYIWENLHQTGKKLRRMVVIPANEIISEKYKISPGKTQAQWISDCCVEFIDAMRGEN